MAQHVPRDSESTAAVERLHLIQAHQASLAKELVNNWRGWAGSFALHVSILLLFAVLVHGVVQPPRSEYIIQPTFLETAKEYEQELPDFENSRVMTEIPEPASVLSEEKRKDQGYNDLDPGVPDYITSGAHLVGPIGKGGGGGDDKWAGKGWHDYIGTIQRTGLEVVFCFDSTGSMGGPITEVRTRIKQLMKVVTFLVPNARIGLVTYRDKKKYDLDDYEYTVKYLPLMKGNKEGLDKLQRFLRETEAYGGGDIPEAVMDGVQAAIEKSEWTPQARRIIIVFGDAPPRPEDNGLAKMYDLCRKWKDTHGILSCIDTNGGSRVIEEFRQMAADGGGEATFLNDDRAIVKQLVVLMFGSKWKDEIDKIYNTVLKDPEDTVVGE